MDLESMSGGADENRADGEGLSRRSVLKAGAHAAWAVPLVHVVAAAPAMAVSGPANRNRPPIRVRPPRPRRGP